MAYNEEPNLLKFRQVYQIALKEEQLDNDAVLKATEAHLKCLQTDQKGRVVVRKWTSKEDILSGLVQCAYKFDLKNMLSTKIHNSKLHYSQHMVNLPLFFFFKFFGNDIHGRHVIVLGQMYVLLMQEFFHS